MSISNDEILAKFEEVTTNAVKYQLQLLRKILDRNSGVSYLRRYLGVGGNEPPYDVASFRRDVPLSFYEDYVELIDRIADGEENDDHHPLLSVDPLICFFYSSGTTSMKPKLIPYFDTTKNGIFVGIEASQANFFRLFPPKSPPGKILFFGYARKTTITKGGYEAVPVSTYAFKGTKDWSHISSPPQIIFASNVHQQTYCHLLCALRNFDSIDGIRAVFAVILIDAFNLLKSNWTHLSNDLQNGFPDSQITDVSLRNSVEQVLGGPQPELSERIRSICGDDDNWVGIVPKLWPNARYIVCVSTGVMQIYYPKLKRLAGDLPVLGSDFMASECVVGLNFDITQPPENTLYVLQPTSAYFEFLPFDSDKNQAIVGEKTVDISGVEIGKLYELVVTTIRGLYRYRLGDIVRVMGFHNSSPKVQFAIRAPKNPLEVITERDLISGIERFQTKLENESKTKIEIVDFASFLDLKQGNLKVFIELGNDGNDWMEEERVLILKNCLSAMEDGLGNLYRTARDGGDIKSLVVSIVKPGAFNKLKEKVFENGTTATQYKPQKIIRNLEFIDLLQKSLLISV